MARSVIGAIAALLLLLVLLANAFEAFPNQVGVDFYQFWGIAKAKREAAIAASPYVEPARYEAALDTLAAASSSDKERAASGYWHPPQPTGTPFFYSSFAVFPSDYESAQAIYVTLLYIAAGFGVFALARLRGLGFRAAICVALAMELTFEPFMLDIRAANVNSLQLAVVVALVWIAARKVSMGNRIVNALPVGLLGPFILFKPNAIGIAIALALQALIVRGWRSFRDSLAMAAVLSLGAFAIGEAFFGSFAWAKWWSYARGLDGSGITLSVEEGNQSIALWLAHHGHVYGSLGYGLLLAAVLLLLLALAMSSMGRRADLLLPAALRCLADPWFAATVGVLLTFALSPLVWGHYFVFLLVPIAWLFLRDGPWGVGTWGAAICYVILTRQAIDLLVSSGNMTLLYAVAMLSWLALVPGMLAYAAQQRRSLEVAA